jgi:hypothetical protein
MVSSDGTDGSERRILAQLPRVLDGHDGMDGIDGEGGRLMVSSDGTESS